MLVGDVTQCLSACLMAFLRTRPRPMVWGREHDPCDIPFPLHPVRGHLDHPAGAAPAGAPRFKVPSVPVLLSPYKGLRVGRGPGSTS